MYLTQLWEYLPILSFLSSFNRRLYWWRSFHGCQGPVQWAPGQAPTNPSGRPHDGVASESSILQSSFSPPVTGGLSPCTMQGCIPNIEICSTHGRPHSPVTSYQNQDVRLCRSFPTPSGRREHTPLPTDTTVTTGTCTGSEQTTKFFF